MWPLCRAVPSFRWKRIRRSVSGSVSQLSSPFDGGIQGEGRRQSRYRAAGFVLAEQLADRYPDGDAHLAIGILLGPRTVVSPPRRWTPNQ
jgi:hypothetical protein